MRGPMMKIVPPSPLLASLPLPLPSKLPGPVLQVVLLAIDLDGLYAEPDLQEVFACDAQV